MGYKLLGRALEMALGGRKPAGGLIQRSDRGGEYAAKAYQQRLDE